MKSAMCDRTVKLSLAVGATFLFSFTTLFSPCHGVKLIVGEKLEDGELSERLHVTGKYLVFWCRVIPDGVPSSGVTGDVRRALGHTLMSLGHTPSITIYNSTWRETFFFDKTTWNTLEGEWRLFIPKSRFSFSDDFCEEWMASVQLDVNTNLLRRKATLLDSHRVPILSAHFGSLSIDSAATRSEVGTFKSCQLGQSACSPDVLIALCQAESKDIFLGITHGAYSQGSTRWMRVDLCNSLTDCGDTTVYDVVLSHSHILVLSSVGLLTASMSGEAAKVVFEPVELAGLSWSDWTLSFTPWCSASNKNSHWTEDLVFLSPNPMSTNLSRPVVGYWSVPPYEHWTPLEQREAGEIVQLMAYDWHHRTVLSLIRSGGDRGLFLTVHPVLLLTSDAIPELLLPPAPLPQEFEPVGYCFHPTTNHFYMFGNQIWISNDGGTTVRCLKTINSGESVISCHPSRSGWVAFLTTAGNILYTHAGHSRILHLGSIPPSSSLIVDGLGKLMEVTRSQHWLSTNDVDIEAGLGDSLVPLRGVFSIMLLSPLEMIITEHSGYQLESMVGALLRHQSSEGTLLIDRLLPPSAPDGQSSKIRALASVKTPLDAGQDQLCMLEITPISTTLCNLRHVCGDNSTGGWDPGDVSKTVYPMDGPTPRPTLLVLTVVNTSDALGLVNTPALLLEGDHWLTPTHWELLDTRSQAQSVIPAETLTVDRIEWEATLPPESEFEFLPSHEVALIVTSTGEARIENVRSGRLIMLSLEAGNIEDILYPGDWAMFNNSLDSLWYYQEDVCRHTLHLDGAATQHSVRYLDLGSSFTFRAVASSMDDSHSSSQQLMKVTVSHPSIASLATRIHYNQYGSEVADITITNSMYAMGTTAVTVSIPAASLRCTDTTFTLTLHATCPPSKHLHFIYDPLFTDNVFLHGDPVDKLNRPLLKDLETNYRPPSTLGKDIPISNNIYNADPAASRPREKYDISKATGHFKQCAGKSSREECTCTVQQSLSSLAINSDCRQRVHRLLHAGKVTLKFLIREAGAPDTPVQEPVALTLTEINDRIDYIVSAPSTPSLDMLGPLSIESSTLWNSTAVQLTLTGSGLYHFQARIATGFSYCDLQDELQYYVDLAPLANPTPTIVISAVSLVMGGVFFVWYLQYLNLHPQPPRRLDGTQCPVGQFH